MIMLSQLETDINFNHFLCLRPINTRDHWLDNSHCLGKLKSLGFCAYLVGPLWTLEKRRTVNQRPGIQKTAIIWQLIEVSGFNSK